MISVRTFEPRDIPGVLELWRVTEGLGRGPGDTPEGVARFLDRNPGLSWVAADGEAIVGAILCGDDGRRGQIYKLAVAVTHRRHGLASSLLQRALAGLREAGVQRCLLTVLTGNDAAAKFYESLGARPRSELNVMSFDL